tara:strand:- start:20 stop:232 length:213 start_codon:yes stop_codon:yes gene_type:complete
MITVVNKQYETQLGGNHSGTVYSFSDGSCAFRADNFEDFWAETEDDLWDAECDYSIPGRHLDAIRIHNAI